MKKNVHNEVREWLLLYNQGDQNAREQLVKRHLPLVRAIANDFKIKFCLDKTAYNDLVQEGTMALLYSIDNYDLESGNTFYTYCKRAITNQLHDAQMQLQQTMTVPNSALSELYKWKKEGGETQHLSQTKRRNLEKIESAQRVKSVDAPVDAEDHEDHRTFGDTLHAGNTRCISASSEMAESAENIVVRNLDNQKLYAILETMTPEQQAFVQRRLRQMEENPNKSLKMTRKEHALMANIQQAILQMMRS